MYARSRVVSATLQQVIASVEDAFTRLGHRLYDFLLYKRQCKLIFNLIIKLKERRNSSAKEKYDQVSSELCRHVALLTELKCQVFCFPRSNTAAAGECVVNFLFGHLFSIPRCVTMTSGFFVMRCKTFSCTC